jgi:uncharacterized protein YndB with AHSA1/START domain
LAAAERRVQVEPTLRRWDRRATVRHDPMIPRDGGQRGGGGAVERFPGADPSPGAPVQRDLHLEQALDHPPERVWRAVSDPSLLGAWFMANDLRPDVGCAFTFRMKPQRGWDGITHGEVIDVDPGRSIAFTYRGEATGEKTLACAGVTNEALKSAGKGVFTRLDTVLRFTVVPEGTTGGTRLVLDHTGFRGLQLVLVSFVMGFGWKRVLKRLPPVLDAVARGETPPVLDR